MFTQKPRRLVLKLIRVIRRILFISFMSWCTFWMFYVTQSGTLTSMRPVITNVHHPYQPSRQRNPEAGSLPGNETPPEKSLAETLWRESVERRHDFMADVMARAPNASNLRLIFDLFPPTYRCPYTMQKIGAVLEDHKWVCGLERYEPPSRREPCVVYSFGIGLSVAFEKEILKRTSCDVFAFDPEAVTVMQRLSKDPAFAKRVTVAKLGLGVENTATHRILRWLMEENRHSRIDILKMDIECYEYPCLEQIASDFDALPFDQLLVEVHGVNFCGIPFRSAYRWFETLETKGLREVFTETNQIGALYQQEVHVEYTFLNVREPREF